METIPTLPSSGSLIRTKSSGSRLKARTDVILRRRTLDDFPMNHDRRDALRMLKERRTSQANHLADLQSALRDTRVLSAKSRNRFQCVVEAERGGQGVERCGERVRLGSAVNAVDKTSGHVPTLHGSGLQDDKVRELNPVKPALKYSRQRPNSIASSVPLLTRPQEVVSPLQRPVSEPPRLQPSGGRSLNHLRTCLSSYPPGLRQLLQDYNRKLRVECEPPTAIPEVRSFSHCRLIPLVDEAAERQRRKEEEEAAEAAKQKVPSQYPLQAEEGEEKEEIVSSLQDGDRPSDKAEQELDVSVRKKRRKSKGKISIASTSQPKMSRSEPEPPASPVPELIEPVSPLSPPRSVHCWVDDATVSSVSLHLASEPEPLDTSTPLPQTQTPDDTPIEADKAGPGDHEGGERKSRGSAAKPTSPPGVVMVTMEKGKLPDKTKRKPEPGGTAVDVLPEVPTAPIEGADTPHQEGEGDGVQEEEVVVEVVEPILPSYACPSSEMKSHMTETKRWLMRSSFSTASHHTPLL